VSNIRNFYTVGSVEVSTRVDRGGRRRRLSPGRAGTDAK
jgi:hypothetical protein